MRSRGGDDDLSPFLVTLGVDPDSFARLDALRRRYFPPARNVVPAHVSLFHQLPGDELGAIRATLERAAVPSVPIPLTFAHPFKLGRGVAIRVEAPELLDLHAGLATAFARWLTPQDRQPYRPHVTVMNKAEPVAASRAFAELRDGWGPWMGASDSILLWRYLGGPWELEARFAFASPTAAHD